MFLDHAKEFRLDFSRKPWRVCYPGKGYNEITPSQRELCKSQRGEESWMGTSATQTSERMRQRDSGDCPRAGSLGRRQRIEIESR